MKVFLRYMALCVLLCTLSFHCSLYAQNAKEQEETETKDAVARIPFFNRIAFKTNAVDWLAVLPNFGVELQVTNDPYKYMTLGLSAKYNWNSYHGTTNKMRYSPAVVYDVFDIRPEFRYYYRTTPRPNTPYNKMRDNLAELQEQMAKAKTDEEKVELKKKIDAARKLLKENSRSVSDWFKQDIWTTDRREPRTWRAHYIGAYASYASYAFKFGPRGIRARHSFGIGATAGYVLPLYEYNKGAIDIDLGFSVGVQVAKHEVFTHSMDGNYYTKVQEGPGWFSLKNSSSRYMPYPVVSELRVAFVWRKQSLKYEAKTDVEKIKAKQNYEKNMGLVMKDLESIMPIKYKYRYDSDNKDDIKRWKQNDTLYRAKFIAAVQSQKEDMLKQVYDPAKAFNEKQLERLEKMVNQRETEMVREFDRLRAEEKRTAAHNAKSSQSADKTDKKGKEKQPKTEKAKTAKEPKSAKEPKAEKPEKGKTKE